MNGGRRQTGLSQAGRTVRRGGRRGRRRDGAERDAGADAGNRRARRLDSGEVPQGGRAARRLRADRAVVLQGRQDRRAERHLQGCGRAAGQGNPGQGRLEGSHLRERHDRAAARRLRPVRFVADLSGSARARGRFRRPILFEGLVAAVPQGQRRIASRRRRTPTSPTSRSRSPRARARSRAFRCCSRPSRRSSRRPARSRSAPSRCAPRRPTCGSAATAT